jgi:hypothetical protein
MKHYEAPWSTALIVMKTNRALRTTLNKILSLP